MNTKHLDDRCQQRGITPLMLDALSLYGTESHQQDGAIRTTFTKKGFKKFEKDIKIVNSKLEQLRKIFLVEKNGLLLTTGYQTQHVYK
jgi:hypothetical protein